MKYNYIFFSIITILLVLPVLANITLISGKTVETYYEYHNTTSTKKEPFFYDNYVNISYEHYNNLSKDSFIEYINTSKKETLFSHLYYDYKNSTKTITSGYIINTQKLDFEDCNVYCNINSTSITCDSILDGNGDGILSSGESGFTIDLTIQKWNEFNKKVDSNKFESLRKCLS